MPDARTLERVERDPRDYSLHDYVSDALAHAEDRLSNDVGIGTSEWWRGHRDAMKELLAKIEHDAALSPPAPAEIEGLLDAPKLREENERAVRLGLEMVAEFSKLISQAEYGADELGQGDAWESVANTMRDGTMASYRLGFEELAIARLSARPAAAEVTDALNPARTASEAGSEVEQALAHFETAVIHEADGASRHEQGSARMEELREKTILTRAALLVAALQSRAREAEATVTDVMVEAASRGFCKFNAIDPDQMISTTHALEGRNYTYPAWHDYKDEIRAALEAALRASRPVEGKVGLNPDLSTDQLIDLLTDGEGDSVTFCSSNVDFNGLPNECVIVNAFWTDSEDREFRADTRRDCLMLALDACRRAALATTPDGEVG